MDSDSSQVIGSDIPQHPLDFAQEHHDHSDNTVGWSYLNLRAISLTVLILEVPNHIEVVIDFVALVDCIQYSKSEDFIKYFNCEYFIMLYITLVKQLEYTVDYLFVILELDCVLGFKPTLRSSLPLELDMIRGRFRLDFGLDRSSKLDLRSMVLVHIGLGLILDQ